MKGKDLQSLIDEARKQYFAEADKALSAHLPGATPTEKLRNLLGRKKTKKPVKPASAANGA